MSPTPTHKFQFDGSVAVITGGGSGIGRASALAFAREGSDVVVSDLDEERAGSVAAEVEALGRKALPVRTDVSSVEELDDLVARSIEWQGHLDLFFSNAGMALSGEPDRLPFEDWVRAADINIWPSVRILPTALRHMLERGSGYILLTSSAAGLVGNPGTAPYVMTKFAVVGLAESLAIYCSGKGVGVSVACPMVVATNLVLTSAATAAQASDPDEANRRRMLAFMRMQSVGIPPEQVADSIVEGVKQGRLYVLPQPEIKDVVRRKWDNPDLWVRGMASVWRKHPEALDPSAG